MQRSRWRGNEVAVLELLAFIAFLLCAFWLSKHLHAGEMSWWDLITAPLAAGIAFALYIYLAGLPWLNWFFDWWAGFAW